MFNYDDFLEAWASLSGAERERVMAMSGGRVRDMLMTDGRDWDTMAFELVINAGKYGQF